jgi:hypothetical protein
MVSLIRNYREEKGKKEKIDAAKLMMIDTRKLASTQHKLFSSFCLITAFFVKFISSALKLKCAVCLHHQALNCLAQSVGRQAKAERAP